MCDHKGSVLAFAADDAAREAPGAPRSRNTTAPRGAHATASLVAARQLLQQDAAAFIAAARP